MADKKPMHFFMWWITEKANKYDALSVLQGQVDADHGQGWHGRSLSLHHTLITRSNPDGLKVPHTKRPPSFIPISSHNILIQFYSQLPVYNSFLGSSDNSRHDILYSSFTISEILSVFIFIAKINVWKSK